MECDCCISIMKLQANVLRNGLTNSLRTNHICKGAEKNFPRQGNKNLTVFLRVHLDSACLQGVSFLLDMMRCFAQLG